MIFKKEVICIFSFLFVSIFGQKKEQLQKQNIDLKREIASINEDLMKSRKEKGLSVLHLQALGKKILLREKIITNTKKEKRYIEDDIYLRQLEINKYRRELSLLQGNYAQVLVKAYKNAGVQNKVTFILSSKNLGEALRRLRYLKQYSDYQIRKAQEISDKTKKIKKTIALREKAKAEKLKLLASQQKDLQALSGERLEKNKLVNEFRDNEVKLTAKLKKKRSQSEKLESQIRAIINEEIRIAKAKAEAQRRVVAERKRLAEISAANEKRRIDEENRKKIEEAKRLREKAEAEEKRLEDLARKKEKEEGEALLKKKSNEKLQKLSMEKNKATEEARIASEKVAEARAAEYDIYRKTEEKKKEVDEKTMTSFPTEGKATGEVFEKNKGKLPFPVNKGQITHNFGRQPHPVFKNIEEENTGVKIAVPEGTKALCVFPGLVTSIIYSTGLKTVIVKHAGYFSIYGNLDEIYVSKNQRVFSGTPIGEIATDFEGVYTLDFQIWNGSVPMNPLDWVLN